MPYNPLVALGRSRVCHVCQLGSRLGERGIGAFVVYLGLEHDVTVHVRGAEPRVGRIVALDPFRRHRILAGRQHVCTVLVEPESVSDECLRSLAAELNGRAADAASLGDILDFISDAARSPDTFVYRFGQSPFDRLFFRYDLEIRPLDSRISKVADILEREIDTPALTEGIARQVELSTSRLRKLFRESTGVKFRDYRMWRRARTYLNHINSDLSLTETALELGYPDSTHFSHSIRQTYGLPPREMRARMRQSVFMSMGS